MRVNGDAVAIGATVDLVVVLLGATVPVPRSATFVGLAILLAGGTIGGVAAATAVEADGRDRVLDGSIAGVAGGVLLAVAVWTSANGSVLRVERSALWTVNYLVATNPPLSPSGMARHGDAVLATVALACGLLYALEGLLGGLLIAGGDDGDRAAT